LEINVKEKLFLDAMLLNFTDHRAKVGTEFNQISIVISQEEFGAYDKDLLKESQLKVGNWLSP